MALIADGRADLADGIDEFDAQHPFGRREFDLARKVVDVFNQRAQDYASALGGLGPHRIDDIGSEVGVELALGRHGAMRVQVQRASCMLKWQFCWVGETEQKRMEPALIHGQAGCCRSGYWGHVEGDGKSFGYASVGLWDRCKGQTREIPLLHAEGAVPAGCLIDCFVRSVRSFSDSTAG